MAIRNFGDIIDPLAQAASVALLDRNGAGRDWARAVAAGNVNYYPEPGARIRAQNEIAVGVNLQGTACNSIVISKQGGSLQTRDSVVVGNNVRVKGRGRTQVRGIGAKVTVKGRKSRAKSSVKAVDVEKRKKLHSTKTLVGKRRAIRAV